MNVERFIDALLTLFPLPSLRRLHLFSRRIDNPVLDFVPPQPRLFYMPARITRIWESKISSRRS